MTEQQTDADRRFGPRATAVIREWTGAHPAEDREPSVAEAELDYWMTRAYEAEGKLWKAEARIRAVQHLIDQADEMGEWAITCTRLQWAVDGSAPQPGA